MEVVKSCSAVSNDSNAHPANKSFSSSHVMRGAVKLGSLNRIFIVVRCGIATLIHRPLQRHILTRRRLVLSRGDVGNVQRPVLGLVVSPSARRTLAKRISSSHTGLSHR